MTRADFRDWLNSHGCKFEPLKESTTGNSIKVINPKHDKHIFLDLPFDERPSRKYTICTSCIKLMIPIPDACKHLEDLENHIKDRHYPNH